MTIESASDIKGLFPHQKILRFHDVGTAPTYNTILPSLHQLNTNATSIGTLGRDGLLGHLVLTIGQTEYQELNLDGVPHEAPVRPPIEAVIPGGATQAVRGGRPAPCGRGTTPRRRGCPATPRPEPPAESPRGDDRALAADAASRAAPREPTAPALRAQRASSQRAPRWWCRRRRWAARSAGALVPRAPLVVPGPCSGHGRCSLVDGTCTCHGNFTGEACDVCKVGWSGAGCDTCADGYWGPSCTPCPRDGAGDVSAGA